MASNIYLNGGIEQAFLELANEDGLLSDSDKERLKILKSLPQNRAEIDGQMVGSVDVKTYNNNPV